MVILDSEELSKKLAETQFLATPLNVLLKKAQDLLI
jgi:hypothetical protein